MDLLSLLAEVNEIEMVLSAHDIFNVLRVENHETKLPTDNDLSSARKPNVHSDAELILPQVQTMKTKDNGNLPLRHLHIITTQITLSHIINIGSFLLQFAIELLQ